MEPAFSLTESNTADNHLRMFLCGRCWTGTVGPENKVAAGMRQSQVILTKETIERTVVDLEAVSLGV